MNQLIVATRNPGKLKEIQSLLSGCSFDIRSVLDFPDIPDVVEDGATLEDNALKKAREVYAKSHLPTIADDSGLEVYALQMQPGVISARYAGENVSYEANNEKLLRELQDIPEEQRQARFRCIIAFISEREEKLFEGICEGVIVHKERGTGGFGYDPLFQPLDYTLTFAELPLEIKNLISHRAKALRLFKNYVLST